MRILISSAPTALRKRARRFQACYAAQACIAVLLEKGKSIPPEIETANSPVVAVSV